MTPKEVDCACMVELVSMEYGAFKAIAKQYDRVPSTDDIRYDGVKDEEGSAVSSGDVVFQSEYLASASGNASSAAESVSSIASAAGSSTAFDASLRSPADHRSL